MNAAGTTAAGLRRTAAVLLAAAAAYLVLTDWIIAPWSASVAFAAVFTAAGVTAVCALGEDFEIRTAWVLVPLAAVVLLGLAQLALGTPDYRFATWWSTLGWAAALALVWSGLQAFSAPGATDAFRRAAVAAGALLALEAVLQLFSGDPRIYGLVRLEDQLPMGPFLNRDHYCALMELILPLALWGGIRNRRWAWIYFTSAGVMYASVIASTSRAGLAIATLEIVVLLVLGIRLKRTQADPRAGRMTAAIATLAAVGGGVAGWSAVLERFQSKDLFAYRGEFLVSTLRMIHDRPFLGFGLGSWPWVYPRYAIIDPVAVANHAHNDWAEWTSEGGILFGALIALVALRCCWLSLEMPWGIGAVAVFAHAAVDFPFQRPPLLLAVLLVLVILEVEHSRHRPLSPRAGVQASPTGVESPSEVY
ncbi:MAG TPA: O-antigen ligase family protein [Bryobacteraceae bacterium]|nr:O-antigen ligase family protein [Bryobacteraceae bacterium]